MKTNPLVFLAAAIVVCVTLSVVITGTAFTAVILYTGFSAFIDVIINYFDDCSQHYFQCMNFFF